MNGHKEVVELLLDVENININAKDEEVYTPLSAAAKYGHKDICGRLIEKGANSDKQTNRLKPLYIAAQESHILLFHALKAGNPGAADWLLSWGAEVDSVDDAGQTSLHIAVKGSVHDVQMMINYGASVNIADRLDRTHVATVRVLLDHDERVTNAKNRIGHAPLHKAATNRGTEVVKVLLQTRAETNKDKDGKTALHVMASRGAFNIACTVIIHRCNVELRDYMGQTPLHIASANGHRETMDILIRAGANLEARDHNDQTFLDIAEMNGYRETVAQFKITGPKEPRSDDDWHMQTCISLRASPSFPELDEPALAQSMERVKWAWKKWIVAPCHIPALLRFTLYDILILCGEITAIKSNPKENAE
ncbi:uncharacterized protein TRUGW13939_08751 [Talaromyces rugulosus]|uniref:Uncharacterized protein n=1 Tax=Talaromyces rugulosus TaxID=121627 RepID=A0A7H8R5E2_TALRU|nr:uncharacterized protein TRUGW13939_08751 [Talaromyces rugulosus]QKX61599.1 hypothetical protein TRUGW13939_08751 [Talaromyces rugulosus]